MSVRTVRSLVVDRSANRSSRFDLLGPTTVGVAIVMAAYVYVFYTITRVVGGSLELVGVVFASMLFASFVGRHARLETGLAIAGLLFVVGMIVYVLSVPASQRALLSVGGVLLDTIALVSGLSVLRLSAAQTWVLSIVPFPTFLAWYLLVRGRDVAAVTVAGGTLGFLVLTGDAGLWITAFGAAGVVLCLALETLSVPGGIEHHWDTVLVVLVAIVLFSATISVFPGGAAVPAIGDGGTPTAEESYAASDEELEIQGSVQLNPELRFVVESDQPARWRTGSFDRYTGDGWVRTGEATALEGDLEGPPGRTVTIEQLVRVESDLAAIPTAWQPTELGGVQGPTPLVDPDGGLTVDEPFEEGDAFAVVSERPAVSPDELRAAGTDYPDNVADRYTQLPESTPDRVGEFTAELIEEDDNPYDAAVTIQTFLEAEHEYSLHVERPDGDIADAFIFEMDAGYCTYYATTMVTMLRTQGVPARFVTGYSTGERIGEDRWAVRGMNAHAWVEVYFPGHGWIEFDPTPSADYDDERETRLTEARQDDEEMVDTEETDPDERPDLETEDDEEDTSEFEPDSEEFEGVPEEDVDPQDIEDRLSPGATGDIDEAALEGIGGTVDPEPETEDDSFSLSGESIGLIGFAVVGLIAGAHRFGYTHRGYRAIWIRFQWGRRGPNRDVRRAYRRLETALAERHRPRAPGETPRSYVGSIAIADSSTGTNRADALTVVSAYERATYGGGVDRRTADEVVSTVDRLTRSSNRFVDRLLSNRFVDRLLSVRDRVRQDDPIDRR